jgi:peptidoglycan/xylan/chitin deacetylase (PgdA/CDA1 family)
MSSMTLAFHAEKLHQSQVWQKTHLAARLLAKHGIHGTFFVYPFPAAVYGEDISSRVRTLAALGHEIAQHTHFYAGSQIDKSHKVDDLSRENIAYCLRRDFVALSAMGCSPRGFTAGSWFVDEMVLEELVDLGFIYDCSARCPGPKPPAAPDPRAQWLNRPQTFRTPRGQLLRLPTACSLGEWFKWGHRRMEENLPPHRIVYLHDFDLLTMRGRLMFSCFLRLVRSDEFATTANAARQYLESGGAPACQ